MLGVGRAAIHQNFFQMGSLIIFLRDCMFTMDFEFNSCIEAIVRGWMLIDNSRLYDTVYGVKQ